MPCSGGLCPWRPGPGEERDHVRPETGHGLASGPPSKALRALRSPSLDYSPSCAVWAKEGLSPDLGLFLKCTPPP